MDEQFLKSNKACQILGLCPETLRRLDREGHIQTIRTSGGIRLYNIAKYISQHRNKFKDKTDDKISICYCRVSTSGQKDDLKRQIDFMQQKYPNHKIITDVGSGINFKRKGLKTILELGYNGKIKELVVAYKDRLCRFAFELIEHVLKYCSNAKIVVLNKSENSPNEEIVEDVLQILNVFSARINGARKYTANSSKSKNISKQQTETNT